MVEYLDYKKYFSQKIIFVTALLSVVSAIVSIVIAIINQSAPVYTMFFEPFNIKSDFIKVLSFILSFDWYAAAYSTAFFMLYFMNKDSKKLLIATFILFIAGLVKIIVSLLCCGYILIYGMQQSESEAVYFYKFAALSLVLIIAFNLPQFQFFCSVRKSVKYNVNRCRGAKTAAITSYILSIFTLLPIFQHGTSISNVFLILTTSAAYLFQGIVAHSYYNFVTNRGFKKSKYHYRRTIRRR